MNPQIRRLFNVVLVLFAMLGVAVTYIQFVKAPELVSDPRNSRRYLEAAERDRGPIIVAGSPVAFSERQEDSPFYVRTYANGPLYAPITGYFSAVNLTATGMEAAANSVLEGGSNTLFFQRIRDLFAGKPRQGGGVVLTIDPALQQASSDLLGGRPGAVVVLDAKTSAVRALYSSPSFDPNSVASLDSAVANDASAALEADPTRPLDNRAIAGTRYAPGSVFKIITAVAMLENGLTPDAAVDAPVAVTLPNTETQVANVDQTECGNGHPTLTEAFARSCNTAFILASEDLPATSLADTAARFGFGEQFTIPMAVTPSYFPQDTDAAQLAMSAIGQFEVQATPMQMAMVAQAIANDGVMMEPFLIESIVDADNQVRSTTSPHEAATPVSATVAEQITTMMKAAVSESYGSGRAAALDGVQVAAKTGTAEVGDGSRTNAWTVAFAPADDPQLVVAVLVENTDADPNPHGGAVAAPIAGALLGIGLQ